jgi:phosphopentomutase
VITLTTHTPYKLIEGEREIFANPQTIAQRYLNNMRYLDNQLRDYIGALQSATVVLYSDHPADPTVGPEFVPSYQGSREFVPCLIHDSEIDLGPLQRSRACGLADNGSLTLLDIANYLRTQIAGANGHALPVVVNQSGGWRLAIEK